MKRKMPNPLGFTLLEIIMSMVIFTIIGVLAGRGLVEIANGYAMARKNAAVAQQGQMTTARLKKEFTAIKSITCGGPKIITYTLQRSDSAPGGEVSTIYWEGGSNPLLLKTASDCSVCTSACAGGDKLAEHVSDFALSYCTTPTICSATFPNSPDFTPATVSIVKFTLKLKGYDDTPISFADPDFVFFGLTS